jgi:hypothetical protein
MARPPQSINPPHGLLTSAFVFLFLIASLANDFKDGLSGSPQQCAIFSITRPLCQ